jgi:thiamine pyrophosphokinase|tara:strand:- start:164 stop:415 length:252 start_codon:yes stop_codon:yes gene_type:complete
MRVIIEESNSENENRQSSHVECEKDDVDLEVAFNLVLRALYAYGYRQDHVAAYINALAAPPPEGAEEGKPDEGTGGVLPDEQK